MERMPSAFTASPQIRIYATSATRQPRSPRSGGLLRTRRSVLATRQRVGSALTNRFRTADDLPVKLALVRAFFHAPITGFR